MDEPNNYKQERKKNFLTDKSTINLSKTMWKQYRNSDNIVNVVMINVVVNVGIFSKREG